MDFVGLLPLEVSLKILANLDLNDILNCSLVSKAWYNATNNNCLWRYFWNPDNPTKECEGSTDFDWTYGFPCKWKLYRMNHYRIINNWKEENYKRFEIDGGSLDDIFYDGKTLVVNNGHLDIYKIDNGTLLHIQTLGNKKNYEPCMCSTNSTFIAVLCNHVITIYQYEHDKYETSYYLFNKGQSTKLVCTKDSKEINVSSDHTPWFSYYDLFFIIGDTLFVYFSCLRVLYAWELKEMKCLLEKEADICNVYLDNNLVYYRMNKYIFVYDKNGKNVMKLKARWNINAIRYNRNIILAQHDFFEEVGLRAWNKMTGKLMFSKKVKGCCDLILHPKKNVIYMLVEKDKVECDRITAYNLLDGTFLWKSPIRDINFFYLYYLVAERFLFMNKFTYHIFDIYDTDSGSYLYSVNDVEHDDLYASYDMLIYALCRNGKLILHIYS